MQESESQEITHLEQYHVNMDWTSHVATQSDNNLINLTPRTFEMFFFFFFFFLLFCTRARAIILDEVCILL